MTDPHEGRVNLLRSFDFVVKWLQCEGPAELVTKTGKPFIARACLTKRGAHAGEWAIRFFQIGEYGRAYKCCWGYYHNCNRTRIGMYCQALDSKIGDISSARSPRTKGTT